MESKTINKYICIVCLISTLSQIPYIYNNSILSKLVSLAWLVLAYILLIHNGFEIPRNNVLWLPIIFDVYCLVGKTILNNDYIGANLFRPVNLCAFVFLVGMLVSKMFNFKSLIEFSKAYIWGTGITSIVIYFQYCFGRSVEGNGYLYNGKNSLASIVLISMILMIILRQYLFTTKMKKISMCVLIGFDIYFLFILKSRTTLLCFAVLLGWFVISRDTKWSVKLLIIAIISIATLYIINNELLYDTIVNTILLNGKSTTNLNDITSNRMDHVETFKTLFPQNEIFGIGGYYLESFPLTALLSFGWLGSVWIFLFALSPIFSGIKGIYYRNKDKIFSLILLAVSISLIVNGLAEEQPPYGPGIKCFAMWFFYGIYCGQSDYVNLREEEKCLRF